MFKLNAHIHTPYSFSSFSSMAQIFDMAEQEDIRILGINDFYETDGYEEFSNFAARKKIFPLFNFEAIALSKSMQSSGIRVNDPANPGRTYLCGKGLDYPSNIEGSNFEALEMVKSESQRQIIEMIAKLNRWLAEISLDLVFSYEEVRSRFARKLVRERHIAQALRVAIFEKYHDESIRKNILQKIYGGTTVSVDINDAAAVENEIRNNMLKAGKKAFVPEDDRAFLSIEQICAIIIEAGGIPCYPVLLDDAAGKFTDFEADKERLYKSLTELDIYCIELIPQRNKLEILEPFVRFFHERGFNITFGTEHNTPGLLPLTPFCSGNVPLTDFLMQVNYQGACLIAAHQYLRKQGKQGYIDANGKASIEKQNDMIQLGDKVIRDTIL